MGMALAMPSGRRDYPYTAIVADYPGAEHLDQVGKTIWYNGIPTIKAKTSHVVAQGLGGVMIWSLDSDAKGTRSLLSASMKPSSQSPRPRPHSRLSDIGLRSSNSPIGTRHGAWGRTAFLRREKKPGHHSVPRLAFRYVNEQANSKSSVAPPSIPPPEIRKSPPRFRSQRGHLGKR